ncbi:unnamed protein product [Macrosiphum euphorbiae]|uniref:Endonuclease/exonuclease/phosphatase domain-containing protein n=1 Tax=Macrosiphum euphorbiae TaxID=13131 RepID=A0AAV0X2C5_9HEMI|nr:unnamed protein product [Macrosiphum euphorbiae]
MCASHVKLEDGSELMMIVVYISPNKKINYIISFLHERLFPYSHRGSIIFKTNKDKLPLILAGDFNVNFAKDESTPLITFLQEEFQLQINNFCNILQLPSANCHSNTVVRGNIECHYYRSH